MKLSLEGQQPTGFFDVMTIVELQQNWEGEKQKHMQQFMYQVKYGEFKNKRAK
jgi:hypothetical protein